MVRRTGGAVRQAQTSMPAGDGKDLNVRIEIDIEIEADMYMDMDRLGAN